jgi:hypothetical protein
MPDTEFPRPDYPTILTKKDWDKKKGVIAKMHGETGIGDMMLACVGAFNDVDWDKLNLFKQRMDWKTVTVKAWEAKVKDAASEMNGKLDKLVKKLYELRDLAKDVQAKFKKSKTIPKASADHVGDIATEADQLGVSLNKNSVGTLIQKMDEEYLEHCKTNFVDIFPAGLKKYIQVHANTIEEVRKSPTLNNFETKACGKLCRDMTTGLGNIAKSHDKGFKVKNGPAAQQLFDLMTPYANLKVKPKSEEEVPGHLDKIEKMFEAVKKFAAGL